MADKTPLWTPSAEAMKDSAMAAFLHVARRSAPHVGDYEALYRWSVDAYRDFWSLFLQHSGIIYEGIPDPVVEDDRMPSTGFFPRVRLSFAENLLRHRDGRTALVSISEARATQRLSFADLHAEVARVQHALAQLGVTPGDRVAGYLPNITEAIVAMLAVSNLGAIWASCSPDFGVAGAVDRFLQIKPRILIGVSGYVYQGKRYACLAKCQAIAQAIGASHLVVVPLGDAPDTQAGHGEVKSTAWADLAAPTSKPLKFVRRPFNHPQYILFSSGTTGIPKCIVHGAGGTLLQHVKELTLHSGIGRNDNILYFTTCGWMMWNWLASALFTGCQVTLFDGSPTMPRIDSLWELLEREQVTHFGTSAKYLASCRGKMSPGKLWDLDKLRVLFSTGSPLSPEDFDWVYSDVKALQLSSISGGTDIISCFMLGNPLLPVYRGEIQCLGLGMDVAAVNETGEAIVHEKGELVCRKPFPSMPVAFWDDPNGEKYRAAYFAKKPNVWYHGDFISITATQGTCGGIVVHGRSDATLKPGGVRIGTAEIYRIVQTLPGISDSIVIGQPWQGDVRVVLFVKLTSETAWEPALAQKIKTTIRGQATPRHVPAVILPVTDIPYTRSGKKMELAVLEVVQGGTPKNLEAMENPLTLDLYRDRPELK